MSPNRGRHIVRQAPPKRLERPSLDRPSLFAGMEAGDSIVPEDDDTPRGGILSTLESVRQRKPLYGRGDTGSRRVGGLWQNRILWGLMGAGVVALLGSFVMIVSEGHTQRMAAQEATMAHAVLARAPSPVGKDVRDLNVLAAPAAGAQAAPSTKVVGGKASPTSGADAMPPPSATIVEAGLGVLPAPAAKVAAAAVSPVPPKPAISPAAQVAKAPAAVVAPAATPRAAAPVVAKAQDKTTSRRSNRKHQDDDVALLEAMFHHSQTRSGAPAAGPSVGEQLKSNCGKLSGAAAATCRARICVSNPGAAICHDTP